MHILYLYACIQIIFESLPVSSSGNVALWIPLLTKRFLLTDSLNDLPAFDFILHIPSLFVIGLFFFHQWTSYVKGFQTKFKTIFLVGIWCLLADSVTVFFYFLFKRVGTAFFPLSCGFLLTTFFLFSLFFYKQKQQRKKFFYKDALILGAVQGCALLPGISRLASTFVTAVWLGYSDRQAFAYSFLLQTPLIVAAGAQGLWHLFCNPVNAIFLKKEFYMLVVGSTIVSFCLLVLVFAMVKQKRFWMFGWYTLFLAAVAFYSGS